MKNIILLFAILVTIVESKGFDVKDFASNSTCNRLKIKSFTTIIDHKAANNNQSAKAYLQCQIEELKKNLQMLENQSNILTIQSWLLFFGFFPFHLAAPFKKSESILSKITSVTTFLALTTWSIDELLTNNQKIKNIKEKIEHKNTLILSLK